MAFLKRVQFEFRPDGDSLKCCLPGKAKALARIVPDKICAGMWRVVRRDGSRHGQQGARQRRSLGLG